MNTQSLKVIIFEQAAGVVPQVQVAEDRARGPVVPKVVTELLINEFGALADHDGEPKHLLFKEDSIFMWDVVILVSAMFIPNEE